VSFQKALHRKTRHEVIFCSLKFWTECIAINSFIHGKCKRHVIVHQITVTQFFSFLLWKRLFQLATANHVLNATVKLRLLTSERHKISPNSGGVSSRKIWYWDWLKYACNEINLTHYLSSVYSVTIPLRFSDMLAAHHQEVVMYICDKRYVLSAGLVENQFRRQSTKTYNTICRIYTLLPLDDGQLVSPKHVEVEWLNKLKIKSARIWFHYTHISRCTVNKTKIG
jgi:hypothetical protein